MEADECRRNQNEEQNQKRSCVRARNLKRFIRKHITRTMKPFGIWL